MLDRSQGLPATTDGVARCRLVRARGILPPILDNMEWAIWRRVYKYRAWVVAAWFAVLLAGQFWATLVYGEFGLLLWSLAWLGVGMLAESRYRKMVWQHKKRNHT